MSAPQADGESASAERYSRECLRLGVAPEPRLLKLLRDPLDHGGVYSTAEAEKPIVDEDCCRALASIAEVCRGVHTLRLVGLRRGDAPLLTQDAIKVLLRGLRNNPSVHVLDLSDDGLEDAAAAEQLASLLAHSIALKTLILRRNRLGKHTAAGVLSALCSNGSLTELDISCNDPIARWESQPDALIEALGKNRSLTSLSASLVDVEELALPPRPASSFGGGSVRDFSRVPSRTSLASADGGATLRSLSRRGSWDSLGAGLGDARGSPRRAAAADAAAAAAKQTPSARWPISAARSAISQPISARTPASATSTRPPSSRRPKEGSAFRAALAAEKAAKNVYEPPPSDDGHDDARPEGKGRFALLFLREFARSMPARLKRLRLAEQLLSKPSIGVIGALLADPAGGLIELDLAHAYIGTSGAKALALALQNGKGGGLQRLKLDNNMVGGDGASALADALHDNYTLLELSLAGNRLDDAAAVMLASALSANGTLDRLDLSRSGVGEIGAKALRQALVHNRTLLSLGALESLPVSVGLRGALDYALQANRDENERHSRENEQKARQRAGMLQLLPEEERALRKQIFFLEDRVASNAAEVATRVRETEQANRLLNVVVARNSELVDTVASLQRQLERVAMRAERGAGARVEARGSRRRLPKKAPPKRAANTGGGFSVIPDPPYSGRPIDPAITPNPACTLRRD